MKIRYLLFAPVLLANVITLKAQQFDNAVKALVEQAYEHSGTLKISNLKIKQSKTDMQTARFTYLPRITANSTYTHLNDEIVFPENLQSLLMGTQKLLVKEAIGVPFNTALHSGVPLTAINPIQDQNLLKITANAQWVLFSGLKAENAIKASNHYQNSLQITTEKEKNQIIIEVSETYDKLALVMASGKVLESSALQLNEQTRYVEGAIKNGLATPLERLRIELAGKRLQLKQIEYTGNRSILLQKLEQLTGTDTLQLREINFLLNPVAISNDTTGSAPRPEIRALDEAVKAASYKIRMERSEYIPKLAAFGQYEFRDNSLSMLDPKWYVGLRLQANIFDGFSARNSARKARADKEILLQQKADAEELIDLARARSLTDLQNANQRLRLCVTQVDLATKTLDLVSKQYRYGLISQTEVLNSITDLERAQLEQQQCFFEQRRAAIKLLEAKGRLIELF